MNKLIQHSMRLINTHSIKFYFATQPSSTINQVTKPIINDITEQQQKPDPMLTVNRRKRRQVPIDPYKRKYFDKEEQTFKQFFFGDK